jgi:hypothetical protein
VRPVLLALAAIALLPATAAAAAPAELAEIEADAALVASGSPAELAAVFAALGEQSGVNAMAIGLGRRAAAATLGWDPGDPAAWAAAGFDHGRPLWISVTIDSAAAAARYRRLSTRKSWDAAALADLPPALWRVRLIAPGIERRAAAAALARVPGLRWHTERWWESLPGARAPHRRDVVAVAAIAGGWAVARSARGALIIDVVRPAFATAAIARDSVAGAAILAVADSPPRRRSLAASPPPAWPRAGGLALWLRASALIDIGRAVQQEIHIAFADADPDRRGAGAWLPNPRCDSFSALAGGMLTDASVRVGAAAGALGVEIVFGAASAGALAKALPRREAGASAHGAGGLAWLAVFTGGSDELRRLPRPEVMQSWPDMLAHLRGCEEHYGWTARIFGWPQIAGLFLSELASLGPRGAAIAAGARGAAAVVRRWADRPLAIEAAVEAALDPGGADTAAGLLDLTFLEGDRARPVERWGQGRLRPYLIRDAGRAVAGATFGGDRTARWFHAARRGAPAWLAGDELAAAWIDMDASLEPLAAWLPAFRWLTGVREIRARVQLRGPRLVAELTLLR